VIQVQVQAKHQIPEFRIIDKPAALSLILGQLTCSGTVVQTADKYIYLKISDEFVTKLFPLIQNGENQMPNYFSGPNKSGAHISIIFPEEYSGALAPEDVGKTMSFSVKDLFKTKILGKTYFAIEVTSTALEGLRNKYGLIKDKINFRGVIVPFHITIGVARVEPS
jgi:hypothetical protein